MNDFQEQAKNWLRNVVKQNPDKIQAGVEKAGDLLDKQTGGKYAEKVDTVQEKVGKYVDSQGGQSGETSGGSSSDASDRPEQSAAPDATATPSQDESTDAAAGAGADQTGESRADQSPTESGAEPVGGRGDGAPDAASQQETDAAGSDADATEAGSAGGDGGVVGGDLPDVEEQPARSAGAAPDGAQTGATATDAAQTDTGSTRRDPG